MRKKSFYIKSLITTCVLTLLSAGFFDATAIERDRPYVADNTIKSDAGTLLRGSTIWLFNGSQHFGFINWATGESCWETFEKYNLNAVRLSCGYNTSAQEDTAYSLDQYLVWLDDFVERAVEKNIYVMIDYHMVGLHPAINHAKTFWQTVAPRYKDRTHVFYELANEPVKWTPADYTSDDMQDQQELYEIVHTAAPNTPIVLMSFAVSQNWGNNPPPHMKDLADSLTGIDWSNSLVGFHGYWVSSSADMQELKDSYPVVNTEFMGPSEVWTGAYSIDNTRWQVEIMEQKGISWFGWNINHNGIGKLPDLYNNAISKGYYWPPDPDKNIIDTIPPSIPINLATGAITDSSVELTWSASTDNIEIVGYKIYIDDSNSIFIPDTNVTINESKTETQYTFKISALDVAGNESACSNILTVTPILINGLPQYELPDKEEWVLNVYPNPVNKNSNLTIKLSKHINSALTISIDNILGKNIYEKNINADYTKVLNMSTTTLLPGIYTVCVNGSGISSQQKLIVK